MFAPHRSFSRSQLKYVLCAAALSAFGLVLALMTSCGGAVSSSGSQMGSASVSISDPPACKFPAGDFQHVFLSVRSVQAHLNPAADDSTPGWQELAPQLATQPVQIDLLASPTTACVLAQLGSQSSLPTGDYQQIRLILVSNQPASGSPVPASNACGPQGFNCVVLGDNSIHILALSSEAQTGLKIPPGQILGGPLRVAAGQNVDINIDFNACASILLQGNGSYRLRPALTAGVVSANHTGISGQIVDRGTGLPVAGGKVIVAVEQADSGNVDRIRMEASADSNGNFNFCPLPSGMYDVVAVAIDGSGVAYNATAVLSVPAGTSLGKVSIVKETGAGAAAGPGTLQGTVTATNAGTGANVDVALSAIQIITLPDTSTRQLTLPAQDLSTPNVTTGSGGACPAGTNCAQYTLIVPASNPSFGIFAGGETTLSTPAVGDVLYAVEARAFRPSSGGSSMCSPSLVTTNKDTSDMPLKVTGGATTPVKQLDLTGCS